MYTDGASREVEVEASRHDPHAHSARALPVASRAPRRCKRRGALLRAEPGLVAGWRQRRSPRAVVGRWGGEPSRRCPQHYVDCWDLVWHNSCGVPRVTVRG